MKKTVITLALMAVAVTAGAQRNDLYSTGKSKSTAPAVSSSSVTRVPVQATSAQAAPVQTVPAQTVQKVSSDDAFDVDTYNRRYTPTSTAATESDYSNTVYVHDTVFYMLESETPQSSFDSYSYHEGYSDAVEDFYATRLITRFHRPGLRLSLALDPFYYDSWYWDSWYYDPWYYDRYYYVGYSYRYYDPWYVPSYHYYYTYRSRPVYQERHYASSPSRHISSGRGVGSSPHQTSRGSSVTRSVTSGSNRSVEPSRTESSRNVGAQHSAERRGVSSSATSGYDRPSSTGTRSVSSGTSGETRSRSEAAPASETRSVSRSVSGNTPRNTGTGSRGENVQTRSSSTRSVSSGSST
ncbi:MAG: hypothetical protein MJY58_07490, partial [Bacteroidaceae bacterium]|nr:hypothetical protein [Bacteroidaceae bacterium]